MKKKILLMSAGIILAFIACKKDSTDPANNSGTNNTNTNTGNSVKKYGVKSGIVEFDRVIVSSGFTINSKKTLYFDEYGMKECEDTYENGVLTQSLFSDGSYLYVVVHEEKAAYKQIKAIRGTAYKFDYSEVSQSDKTSGKAGTLGNEVIAGKTCEAYYYKSSASDSTKFAGWEHICLLTANTSSVGTNTETATSVQVNVAVPASKFAVPAGYTLK